MDPVNIQARKVVFASFFLTLQKDVITVLGDIYIDHVLLLTTTKPFILRTYSSWTAIRGLV